MISFKLEKCPPCLLEPPHRAHILSHCTGVSASTALFVGCHWLLGVTVAGSHYFQGATACRVSLPALNYLQGA
eukprot:1154822-Pelagomonas_calceolata.AAC.1